MSKLPESWLLFFLYNKKYHVKHTVYLSIYHHALAEGSVG